MTPEQLTAFGVTADQERDTNEWIMSHMGCVLGADGRGGSGVFIELNDGRLALLTARHVIVSCILTGEMTVMRLGPAGTDLSARRSAEPDAVRIDCNKDAAYLILESKKFKGNRLPYSAWSQAQKVVSAGMPVISSGVVGEWKQPDAKARVIPQVKVLWYWTSVTEPENRHQLLVCDVDESNSDLPRSFRGMSGGPCFSIDRTLLGINVQEIRRKPGTKLGEIQVVRIHDLNSLFEPFQAPDSDPEGYMSEKVGGFCWAVKKTDKSYRVRMAVHAEFIRAVSKPDAKYGRFGRITAILLNLHGGAERYPINCESVFEYEGNTATDKIKALQEELDYFLMDTGFQAEPDNNPTILEAEPA